MTEWSGSSFQVPSSWFVFGVLVRCSMFDVQGSRSERTRHEASSHVDGFVAEL